MIRAFQLAACLLGLGTLAIYTPDRACAEIITDSYFYWPNGDTVAIGKSGLPPFHLGTSSNYTNVSCGITGVRIVFDETVVDDFSFRTGNTVDTTHWQTLQAPTVTTLRGNEVNLFWSSDAVTSGWLEVTYNPANLVLYFGNLVGDANYDGFVSARDFLEILSNVGKPVTDATEAFDLDCDRTISEADAQIVVDVLGVAGVHSLVMGPFEPSSVPEPSSLLLCASGLLGLWAFRRKRFPPTRT